MGLIIVKKRQVSEVPTPPVGKVTFFVDIADGLLKKKLSDTTVVVVEGGGGAGIKFFWNNQTEQDNETTQGVGDRGVREDLIGRPVLEWDGADWNMVYSLDGDAGLSPYTNAGYPAIQSVGDALDTILYTPISVNLGGGGNYEIGQTVSDIHLSWSLNKTPISQILNQGIGNVLPGITNYSVIGANLTTDTTYIITVDDGTQTAQNSTTVSFLNRVHWGVGAAGQSSDSFILGLANSVLTNQRQRTIDFNVGAGQRGYCVLPSSFGEPTFFVGGFEGGFELVGQVSHTNLFGHTEFYRVYQTEHENLGNTTVVIE